MPALDSDTRAHFAAGAPKALALIDELLARGDELSLRAAKALEDLALCWIDQHRALRRQWQRAIDKR